MNEIEITREIFEHLKKEGFSTSFSTFPQLPLSEIDSLQLATLLLEFEAKCNAVIPVEFLDSVTQKNIEDLVNLLTNKRGQS